MQRLKRRSAVAEQTMLETQLSNFSTFECFSLVQFREISLKFEALVPSTQKP